MSREGRSQPIQPVVEHGFLGNIPANGILPPGETTVPHDPRPRQYYAPALQPVVLSGAQYPVQALPPQSLVVDAGPRGKALSPVQPVVEHGFLGNVPANGTLPPVTVNVDRADQRVRYRPLDPVVLFGGLASTAPPVVFPPAPVNVDRVDRRARALDPVVLLGESVDLPPEPVSLDRVEQRGQRGWRTPDPIVLFGGVPVAAAPFVPPPPLVNVDRADNRAQRRTPDPVALSAALEAVTGAPVVLPAGPFVVPLDERRRFLAALPPSVSHGFDDSDPPLPAVVELDDRRRRIQLPDPSFLRGPVPAPFVPPPGSQSVEPDRRRRVTPEPLSISGALGVFGPFVAPPPVLFVISDERRRRTYPQPIVLAGPAFPPAVVAVLYPFDVPHPAAAALPGVPDDGQFTGDPDDGGLVGAPGGNIFAPSKPGRA